jgi:hypothetical protein
LCSFSIPGKQRSRQKAARSGCQRKKEKTQETIQSLDTSLGDRKAEVPDPEIIKEMESASEVPLEDYGKLASISSDNIKTDDAISSRETTSTDNGDTDEDDAPPMGIDSDEEILESHEKRRNFFDSMIVRLSEMKVGLEAKPHSRIQAQLLVDLKKEIKALKKKRTKLSSKIRRLAEKIRAKNSDACDQNLGKESTDDDQNSAPASQTTDQKHVEADVPSQAAEIVTPSSQMSTETTDEKSQPLEKEEWKFPSRKELRAFFKEETYRNKRAARKEVILITHSHSHTCTHTL